PGARLGRPRAATRSPDRENFELGCDSGALAQPLEPGRERLVRLQVDPEVRACAQDPGDVSDVGEPVLTAAQERLLLQSRLEVAEPLIELRRLVATERVVVVTQTNREPV